MSKRTRTIVIVIVVLGLLAAGGPSLMWYLKQGEHVDPGSQQESQKQEVEQQRRDR